MTKDKLSSEASQAVLDCQQRFWLALQCKDADLFILDEPFSELDAESEIQLLKYLQKISGEGKTILLITHTTAALDFCNRKINMDEQ